MSCASSLRTGRQLTIHSEWRRRAGFLLKEGILRMFVAGNDKYQPEAAQLFIFYLGRERLAAAGLNLAAASHHPFV